MKKDDYNKIIVILNSEKAFYEGKLDLLIKKLKFIKRNRLYNKIFGILKFSAIGYLVNILLIILALNLGLNSIFIILNSPLTVGIISTISGDLLELIHEKSNRFSNQILSLGIFNNEKAIFRKQVELETEKEAILNRILIFDYVINALKYDEQNGYTLLEDEVSYTKSDKLFLDQENKKIKPEIDSQFRELDNLSHSAVIKNIFSNVNDKSSNILDAIIIGLISSISIFVISITPSVLLTSLTSATNNLLSAFACSSVALLASVSYTSYINKIKQDLAREFKSKKMMQFTDKEYEDILDEYGQNLGEMLLHYQQNKVEIRRLNRAPSIIHKIEQKNYEDDFELYSDSPVHEEKQSKIINFVPKSKKN